jgi:hypothetical protein
MKHWVLCAIGDADVAALQVDDLMRPLLNMSAAGKNKVSVRPSHLFPQ